MLSASRQQKEKLCNSLDRLDWLKKSTHATACSLNLFCSRSRRSGMIVMSSWAFSLEDNPTPQTTTWVWSERTKTLRCRRMVCKCYVQSPCVATSDSGGLAQSSDSGGFPTRIPSKSQHRFRGPRHVDLRPGPAELPTLRSSNEGGESPKSSWWRSQSSAFDAFQVGE